MTSPTGAAAARSPGGTGVRRSVTVRPGMCGPSSLFVGLLGDWTWETVSELCETDVFTARDDAGNPTYLAFYYFRVRGSASINPRVLTFGDQLDVVSGCYDQGSESVLTLHRITRSEDGEAERQLDPEEFHLGPRENCLYVENFNRWIARSTPGSNQGLVKASPPGFRHRDLPMLPDRFSPRAVYQRARRDLTFHDPTNPAYEAMPDEVTVTHPVDVLRDVNGVGLLYFASYFSMVDEALLALWRQRGGTAAAFLARTVVDQQICYLGNADVDSVLTLTASSWRRTGVPGDEVGDVVVRDRDTRRVLAVSTTRTVPAPTAPPRKDPA
ncbi:biosynthesis cluster domain-containing protein [Streptomyces sp. RKND-216]|uniref:LnmK family bifunctional acyltransferase/decarboxylase n=1 Tax=Streptomyces sp. RKND-216 TaxID=2562581 RepID=UPI00109DE530|nr:LnmK family bifunctional acyltransferase/decarboxylase [Streptomyces sp. RKND-216]THA24094.1 biosynthesis cluster domain-containing protein [Streptomyces sp. RKND-216]